MHRRFFVVLGLLILGGQGLVLGRIDLLGSRFSETYGLVQFAISCFATAGVLFVVGGARATAPITGRTALPWRTVVGAGAAVFGVGWIALGCTALVATGGGADAAALIAGVSSGLACWLFGLDVASGGRYLGIPLEE